MGRQQKRNILETSRAAGCAFLYWAPREALAPRTTEFQAHLWAERRSGVWHRPSGCNEEGRGAWQGRQGHIPPGLDGHGGSLGQQSARSASSEKTSETKAVPAVPGAPNRRGCGVSSPAGRPPRSQKLVMEPRGCRPAAHSRVLQKQTSHGQAELL